MSSITMLLYTLTYPSPHKLQFCYLTSLVKCTSSPNFIPGTINRGCTYYDVAGNLSQCLPPLSPTIFCQHFWHCQKQRVSWFVIAYSLPFCMVYIFPAAVQSLLACCHQVCMTDKAPSSAAGTIHLHYWRLGTRVFQLTRLHCYLADSYLSTLLLEIL